MVSEDAPMQQTVLTKRNKNQESANQPGLPMKKI